MSSLAGRVKGVTRSGSTSAPIAVEFAPQQQGVYHSRTTEFLRLRPEGRKVGGAGAAWDSGEGGEGSEDALLALDDDEGGIPMTNRNALPPQWVDEKDAVVELMEEMRMRMAELARMHDDHITKPSFDGEMEQEQEIEILTSNITSLFHKCQKLIQVLNRKGKQTPSAQQKRLAGNVVSSIAKDVQTLSMDFRKSQSTYLRRMQKREGRERKYMGIDDSASGRNSTEADSAVDDMMDMAAESVNEGFTDQQIDQLKDNTQAVTQREHEITNIVSSIHELTTIFKDLAQLITEQGTILDRIDYNIEESSHAVEKGRENLEKAEGYQKKASKKLFIMLLIVVCVGLFFGIIFKKKNIDPHISHAPTAQPPRYLHF